MTDNHPVLQGVVIIKESRWVTMVDTDHYVPLRTFYNIKGYFCVIFLWINYLKVKA